MRNDTPRIETFLATIRGWLTKPEARLLFQLAQHVEQGECIVELGSFEGRSLWAEQYCNSY